MRGFKEGVQAIETLARAGGEELVSGVRVAGEEIMTDVKATRQGSGVPVDTGALRGSGIVTGPDGRGKVSLTFGGSAAPYALRQHEDMTLRHNLGEARYLVRALERWARGFRPVHALREAAQAAVRRARRR